MKRLAKDNKGFYLYSDKNTNELIKIPFDNDYDYRYAMGGDAYKVYRAEVQYDAILKENGYEIYFKCNGSLFYKNGTQYDAEGIEVIEGENTQDIDYQFEKDMACIVLKGENKLIFARQSDISNKVDNKECYCGLTGMGILLNGEDYGYRSFNEWNVRSGRTIIGTDKEGNFMSYQFAGTTGKSGKTGQELIQICKDNGFYNALLVDGGGSVYREFNGQKLITTTRAIKNTFIIYRKKKSQDYKELYEQERNKNIRLNDKLSQIKNIVEGE